jgi:hypothetical protein
VSQFAKDVIPDSPAQPGVIRNPAGPPAVKMAGLSWMSDSIKPSQIRGFIK